MRLLDCHSHKLQEFTNAEIPLYAILSHRWENEEVSFQDLQSGRAPLMAGWPKITGCCLQAIKDEYDYVVSIYC